MKTQSEKRGNVIHLFHPGKQGRVLERGEWNSAFSYLAMIKGGEGIGKGSSRIATSEGEKSVSFCREKTAGDSKGKSPPYFLTKEGGEKERGLSHVVKLNGENHYFLERESPGRKGDYIGASSALLAEEKKGRKVSYRKFATHPGWERGGCGRSPARSNQQTFPGEERRA